MSFFKMDKRRKDVRRRTNYESRIQNPEFRIMNFDFDGNSRFKFKVLYLTLNP